MNTKLVFASGLAAVLMAAAPVASAHGLGLDLGLGAHADADSSTKVHAGGLGLSTGAHARADADEHVRAKSDSHDDSWRVKMQERFSHVAAGIVTSVNGSVFTIDPVGDKSTTTVTTNSNTTFRAHGAATSSSALTVGARVLLFGTTTATSTSGDAFTASFVKIFVDGFHHLRFWGWFR